MSSVWDALTGRKSSTASQAPSPGTSNALESHHTSAFDPTSAQGTDVFLKSSTFADPSLLHPLAGLNQEALDYLTLDESTLSDLPGSQSVLPSRGFTDDLCYGTGITYLTALGIGGAWGLQEGLRRSAGQPPKLRMNSVLNSVTRRGPFLGNSAGVLAIVYNCFNSGIGYLRGQHDAANSILAGFLSGVVFKSTRGPRSMLISGGVVASVAGAWAVRLTSQTFARLSIFFLLTVFRSHEGPYLRFQNRRQRLSYEAGALLLDELPTQNHITIRESTKTDSIDSYVDLFPGDASRHLDGTRHCVSWGRGVSK